MATKEEEKKKRGEIIVAGYLMAAMIHVATHGTVPSVIFWSLCVVVWAIWLYMSGEL